MGNEQPTAPHRATPTEAESSSGFIRKSGVAVAGLIVVIVGFVLIPLPGPGWLIVFTGLAILASEFVWAARLRDRIRSRVRRFIDGRDNS